MSRQVTYWAGDNGHPVAAPGQVARQFVMTCPAGLVESGECLVN